LIDPNITRREIQAKTWLHPLTIQKANIELNQNGTKDTTIAYIVWSSKERLVRIQGVLNRFIDEAERKEELSRWDTALIKEIAKDDMTRINIFGGNVTDDSWWFNIETMSREELLRLATQ
jgi:hypothetical protein